MQSLVSVTKKFEFSAAHCARRDDLTPEDNRRLYGRCAGPHGDGHNYLLEVTVSGPVARETGMVIDIAELKRIVVAEVIDRYDHKHLNLDTPDFTDRVPTTENLAVVIWERLEGRLPDGCRLSRIRLAEDGTTYVEFAGERAGEASPRPGTPGPAGDAAGRPPAQAGVPGREASRSGSGGSRR